MTKNDFLDKLRVALTGKVSAALVEENMTYYKEYIESQIRAGKSEQEVMDLLGDPRLIARTIVQTNGIDTAQEGEYREQTSYDDNASGYTYGNEEYNEGRNQVRVRTIPGWLWSIIAILIIICVISLIFSVVSFLLPFVLPILVVLFFVKLFRDWLN